MWRYCVDWQSISLIISARSLLRQNLPKHSEFPTIPLRIIIPGVRTGDSIVIAPTVTLADKEYQMLRSAALNIISSLKMEGGCNVQLALKPDSFEYAVIEVNPRVSRSSALASKATGYPIAKVATLIAIGY